MTKTRSQSKEIPSIKQEDDNEAKTELKHAQLLNGVSTTTKATAKIAKKRVFKNSNNSLSVSEIKLEDHKSNSKSLLQRRKSKVFKRITQEQITQLIHYIENDKMSITAASKKVDISQAAGCKYYKIYKNDPERNIPKPWKGNRTRAQICTQEQIKNLIKHIVDDKMTVVEASKKVKISNRTGYKYYALYLNDPEHNVPNTCKRPTTGYKICTQGQIKSLIHNIVNNGMPIKTASEKVKIHYDTGRKYYYLYMNDPEHKIPIPLERTKVGNKPCKQDTINALIECIENDNMSIHGVSNKLNITRETVRKYYDIYINDPERKIPKAFEQSTNTNKPCTQEKIKDLIGYIINDGISIKSASKKLHISAATAIKYYLKYLNDPNRKIPIPPMQGCCLKKKYPQEKINEFINYVVNDNMSVLSASARAKIYSSSAYRYYRKYLKDLKPQNTVNTSQNCTDQLFINE